MAADCDGDMVEVRIEPLSYLLMHGLPDVAYEAWLDLEHEHSEIPYAPDWESYQRLEDGHHLRFFSLRENENLIGYASVRMDSDEHRNGLRMAFFNDIYVTKAKRGYAATLVKYVEKAIALLGVRRIQGAHKVTAKVDSGKFFKAMGYKPMEIIYAKVLH